MYQRHNKKLENTRPEVLYRPLELVRGHGIECQRNRNKDEFQNQRQPRNNKYSLLASGPDLLIAIVASALVLVPCIWLPQIESFDLASHIYNAWLARLITDQHIHGLWIAHQSTNMLFGNVLTLLMKVFDPVVAQRMAVGAAVLLFFWSSFTLAAAVSNKRPWYLLPCVAVLSYGKIFHYGFFDFYISLAFALLAIALFWKVRSWRLILLIPVLALSWCAHPLPALCAISITAYVYIARSSSRPIQCALWCVAAVVAIMIGLYERVQFPNSVGPPTNLITGLLAASGWDQVLAFGHPFSILSYRFVELGMLFVLALLLIRILRKNNDFLFSIPMQLYTLSCIAGLMLPARKFYFNYAFQYPLGYVAERISLIAAVLACCLVASVNPRKWQKVLLLFFAVVFFVIVHQDERSLCKLETRVDQLVSQLPPLQRVAAILRYPGAEDGFTEDIVDRACVGRCFSYGNYEASTLQFRIRAVPNNPFVLADAGDSERLAEGRYRVRARDLPLYQIYPCGPRITDLCVRGLKRGEINGSYSFPR